MATMEFCKTINKEGENKIDREKTLILNNTGEMTEELLKDLITTLGGEIVSTKK